MTYQGWTLHTMRLGVRPGYPTPYCVRATKLGASGVLLGFTKEGRTLDEALREAQAEIDRGEIEGRLSAALREKNSVTCS